METISAVNSPEDNNVDAVTFSPFGAVMHKPFLHGAATELSSYFS